MEKIVINIIDTHNDFATLERFTQVGAPVLSYSGAESRFDTIMSSKFSFNMLNETAEDGHYLDLLTGEERRFLVEIRDVSPFQLIPANDLDANIVWRGYLLPDIYSEPYDNVNFFVGFTATDGLDILKTKDFLFYKTGSVIDYIAKCLCETGLDQEIYFAPGIENASYDWADIQIFEECFTKYNENTETYDYSNCYDVLDKLLKSVGATVFQYKGKWFIQGFNRKQNILDTYRVYDSFGKFKRNERVFKTVKKPMFSKGLSVSVKSPFKTVQMNMEYQRSKSEVFPEQYYKTETYQESDLSWPALKSLAPWNNWANKAGSDFTYESEDSGTYLKLSDESFDNSHVMHPENEEPLSCQKPPFYLNVYKRFGRPVDLSKDFVELKSDKRIYVSPQVEGKPLEFDFDFEFICPNWVEADDFANNFYKQVFRIDVLLDDVLIFSTRAETNKYQAADSKIEFIPGVEGPEYLWYTSSSGTRWKYRLKRFRIPSRLRAEIKPGTIKTNSFGKLNIRVFTPRNGDNSFSSTDGYHANSVTMTKMDIKVKSWDNERFQVLREIRYTTKFEAQLSFSDGKNDLYDNLFKINDRDDYFATLKTSTLYSNTAPPDNDNLYYWFYVPAVLLNAVRGFYHTLKLYNGAKSVTACLIFGKLSRESGIEIEGDYIRISKSRIDEFPVYRDLLNNITKITIGRDRLFSLAPFDIPRENFLKWKRSNSSETLRYLDSYGRMLHECQPTITSILEGQALDIVFPNDLIEFDWRGVKNFIPTRLSINLSEGKTSLVMSEANFENLNDYGAT